MVHKLVGLRFSLHFERTVLANPAHVLGVYSRQMCSIVQLLVAYLLRLDIF